MTNCEKNSGKTSGCIFDIRRFSVHDGRGIRTTVFFKGCPLRCRWCHNPEGIEDFLKPVWLSGACINCGKCYKYSGAHSVEETAVLLRFLDLQKANEVMDSCPAKALVWNGKTLTIDQTLNELVKDKVFFDHNGGCTLSGGEPLAQGDFVLVLLERMREAGIHTAIETSLFAEPELVDKAAEKSDEIFADCKKKKKKKHIEATGSSNEIILDNLERLLTGSHAHKLTVRIPLIPGFTSENENITAIAGFIKVRNSSVPVELLNFNPLANGKYPYGDFQGKEIMHCKPYTKKQIESIAALVKEKGIIVNKFN
jgi:pyruvate formate lyase activating enzyme